MRRDIFISYKRSDLQKVKKIKDVIESFTKHECWLDIEGIESWNPQFTTDIISGINQCKVFLFMLSTDSQNSEFALRELNYAYSYRICKSFYINDLCVKQ